MDVMGTTFTITAYGEDQYRADAAIDDAFEEARRLDQMLSNYRPESEWSVVNREAASRPVKRMNARASASTGKNPMVAPYSGAMLAMVARSGSVRLLNPVP